MLTWYVCQTSRRLRQPSGPVLSPIVLSERLLFSPVRRNASSACLSWFTKFVLSFLNCETTDCNPLYWVSHATFPSGPGDCSRLSTTFRACVPYFPTREEYSSVHRTRTLLNWITRTIRKCSLIGSAMEHMTENQTLIAADIQQRLQTLVNSINRNAPNGTICLWRSE